MKCIDKRRCDCVHRSFTLFRDRIYIFHLGLTVCPDYFTDFEQSQSFGGAKTRDPRKESLACLICDPSEARTHSSKMTSDLQR